MFICRDGYGKLVQRELEAQRHLIDSGSRSLGSFLPVMPSHCKFQGQNLFIQIYGFPTTYYTIGLLFWKIYWTSFLENSIFFAHMVIAFQSYIVIMFSIT